MLRMMLVGVLVFLPGLLIVRKVARQQKKTLMVSRSARGASARKSASSRA